MPRKTESLVPGLRAALRIVEREGADWFACWSADKANYPEEARGSLTAANGCSIIAGQIQKRIAEGERAKEKRGSRGRLEARPCSVCKDDTWWRGPGPVVCKECREKRGRGKR